MTILVIDDEEMIRELAQSILRHAGFEVLTAESGQSGIRLYAEGTSLIDLVMLDLTMDDMSGVETLRRLREVSPDLPCIISSGQAPDLSDIPQELSRHVYFLQKPYRASQLAEMCHQAVAGVRKQPEQPRHS